ncbi:MAG: CRISPR-associated endonuclease Cas3'', partial [Lysobacteraceae bacterium]
MDTKYWAHVDGEGETLRSHALVEHLRDVGRLAEDFASVFGSGGWAEAAGRWHDLGKFRAGFQHKLRVAGGVDAHIENVGLRVTHSTAGAIHAVQALGKAQGSVLAFLIAGHHAGLPDMHSSDGGAGSLAERLAGEIGQVEVREALSEAIPPEVLAAPANLSEPLGGKEGFALWIRMLFSCLVDADFLDTEAFFDTTRARARESYPNLLEIKQQLDASLAIKSDRARQGGISEVNGLRAQVLTQCRDKGADHNLKPGFFSLTVPTGGGKTLSSLAFALEHAIAHGHRRIIYAIPFTSIIEQTAQVFREALSSLGADVVIEHHSNLDVREGSENHASRLASENWDAPLIVTTNVQLFESLHASRTSRCRKL